jgi:hypothetical protein
MMVARATEERVRSGDVLSCITRGQSGRGTYRRFVQAGELTVSAGGKMMP